MGWRMAWNRNVNGYCGGSECHVVGDVRFNAKWKTGKPHALLVRSWVWLPSLYLTRLNTFYWIAHTRLAKVDSSMALRRCGFIAIALLLR